MKVLMLQIIRYRRKGVAWGKYPRTKHPKYYFVAIWPLEARYFPHDLFGVEYSSLDLDRAYLDNCPHCHQKVTPENNSNWAIQTKRGWVFVCENCEDVVGNCFECKETITNADDHIFKKINEKEMLLLCGNCVVSEL